MEEHHQLQGLFTSGELVVKAVPSLTQGPVTPAVAVSVEEHTAPLAPEALVVDTPLASLAAVGGPATPSQRPSPVGCQPSRANLRRGKWSHAEETYADAVVAAFRRGILIDAEDGCTLRSYLAKKLGCAPMRISKKYPGGCVGKMTFQKLKYTDDEVTMAKHHLTLLKCRYESAVRSTATPPKSDSRKRRPSKPPLLAPVGKTVPMAMNVPPVLGPNGQPMNFGVAMAVFVPFQSGAAGAVRHPCLTRTMPMTMQQQFLQQQQQLQMQQQYQLLQKLQKAQAHPPPSPTSPHKRPRNDPDGSGSTPELQPPPEPISQPLEAVRAVPVRDERAASEDDPKAEAAAAAAVYEREAGVGAVLLSAGDSILDFALMVGDQLDLKFATEGDGTERDQLDFSDEALLDELDFACGMAPPPPFTERWCSADDTVVFDEDE